MKVARKNLKLYGVFQKIAFAVSFFTLVLIRDTVYDQSTADSLFFVSANPTSCYLFCV